MKFSTWIACLATDAAFLGGLYLWQTKGIEGARNVVLVVGWVQAVLSVLVALAAKKGDLPQRYGFSRVYMSVSSIVTVVALAWSGMIALSVTYFVGWIFIEAAREPSKETA